MDLESNPGYHALNVVCKIFGVISFFTGIGCLLYGLRLKNKGENLKGTAYFKMGGTNVLGGLLLFLASFH